MVNLSYELALAKQEAEFLRETNARLSEQLEQAQAMIGWLHSELRELRTQIAKLQEY